MDNITQTLLVEGNDDFHLICNICAAFDVSETFKIEDCKGVTNLLNGLPVRLKGSGEIKTIGIVMDADIDIQARWMQMRQILINSNLYSSIPVDCPRGGAIIIPDNVDDIKIGVWIMPNNNNNGMLEDFATFLIPDDDKLLPEVENVLDSIEARGLNKYKPIHHSKAKIHTWLAWQEDPGNTYGLSCNKEISDYNTSYLSGICQLAERFIQLR